MTSPPSQGALSQHSGIIVSRLLKVQDLSKKLGAGWWEVWNVWSKISFAILGVMGLISLRTCRIGYPYFDFFKPLSKSSFPIPEGSWTCPGSCTGPTSSKRVIAFVGSFSYIQNLLNDSGNQYFLYL